MYALYQNHEDGSFNYATLTSGLGPITRTHSGWGVRFIDYDNDGWKDLLIAQGHDLDTIQLTSPNLRYREPMLLARNTGQSFVFTRVFGYLLLVQDGRKKAEFESHSLRQFNRLRSVSYRRSQGPHCAM